MEEFFYSVRRFFVLALLICGGVFLLSVSAPAQWGMVTDALLKEGQRFYEEGRYEEAIHEFSKVLLSDPRNAEALSYLEQMGLDGGLYGERNNSEDRIYQLSRKVQAYQDGIKALELQNEQQRQRERQLGQMLDDQVQQRQRLEVSAQELRAVATVKLLEQQADLVQWEERHNAQTRELARQGQRYQELQAEIGNVRAEKELFVREAEGIREKIQQHKEELQQAGFGSQQVTMYLEYIQQQNQEISVLREQAARILNELEWLKRQASDIPDGRVDELRDRVTELEDEIRQKEESLEISRGQREILQNRIEEYKERLMIVEDMILDKEQRILLLEDQVSAEQ